MQQQYSIPERNPGWPSKKRLCVASIDVTFPHMSLDGSSPTSEPAPRHLGRRVKELACTYQVAMAIRRHADVAELLREVTGVAPAGWQHPEAACCRVRWQEQTFVSPHFRETPWRQAADLVIAGQPQGTIEVFYLEERPPADEGPFLKEERDLIQDLALVLSETIERRQTEQALRHARAFAENLIQTANVMIIRLDTRGNIQVLNEAAEKITGYARSDLEGRNWFEVLVPKDSYPHVWAEFHRLVAGGIPGTFENPILTKSGEERFIAWRNNELREHGRIVGTISFGVDVTEHRRMEDALRQSLAETRRRHSEASALLQGTRSILQNHEFAPAARSIFDACKSLVGASAGFLALRSADGEDGEPLFFDRGGLPPEMDPFSPMWVRGLCAEACRTCRAVRENRPGRRHEPALLSPRHTAIENVLIAPLLLEGKALGWLGLANKPGDFTEEDARLASAFAELTTLAFHNSQTLQRLQASEERFRSVAQSAGDGIVTSDAQGNIVLWNHAAEEIFGYRAEEVVGRSICCIVPEPFHERHRQAFFRAMSPEAPDFVRRRIEVVACRKDHSEVPVELSLARWRSGATCYCTAVIRNVTERKEADRAIAAERARVDQILNDLLPPLVVDRLKTEQRFVADAFEEISVLFADLVGFTKWTASMRPEHVVELLNRVFTEFDRLARRHGVQKISTQGDGYLAVAGVPAHRPDHADAAADLALEMCQAIRQFTTPHGEPISMRIGIHTGPAMAAIIGQHAYHYDVWGSTVNLASRMESSGKAGCIQVSRQTYERLRKQFRFEKRGSIWVKGIGLQKTYWLKARRLRKETALPGSS